MTCTPKELREAETWVNFLNERPPYRGLTARFLSSVSAKCSSLSFENMPE